MNGWTIVANNGLNIQIQLNLYPDPDGTTTTQSMITSSNNTNVFNRQSDSPIVASELEKSLEYGGIIYVDSSATETGNVYPYGTAAKPVNNMQHAIEVGAFYGFKRFYVMGTIEITSEVSDFEVHGGAGETVITNTGYTVSNAKFFDCTFEGDLGALSSRVEYRDCHIANGAINLTSD